MIDFSIVYIIEVQNEKVQIILMPSNKMKSSRHLSS